MTAQQGTLLFVTDPWLTLDHPRDTTLRLVEEAVGLGIDVHWADVRSVRCAAGAATLDAARVLAVEPARHAGAFTLAPPAPRRGSDFAIVCYRTDPPVDLAYLHPLQLLALDGARRRAEDGTVSSIVNPPEVLLAHSEKLAASCVAGLCPPTLVATRLEDLRGFGEAEGRAIAKPLHACQSRDVELLDFATPGGRAHALAVLERLTGGFCRPAVLQRFLPGVLDGETRVWLLDGEVLGVARKKAAGGSYRIDMDKGGVLLPHRLTGREARALPGISAWLREHGVLLAAVDLIDGWVTDFNFTSPGLVPAMEAVTGTNLARPIVEALASLARGAAARRPLAGTR